MPTTRVPAYKCGTDWSGWLMTAHPTVEDGIVPKRVCFSDRSTGCKSYKNIFVKNCGSYSDFTSLCLALLWDWLKEGLKSLKKIECEGLINSFVNSSFVLYSCKFLLACSDSEWMFMIFSYLPLYKLRLTKSHCIFYHFIACYFLVCKSLP